MNHMTARSVNRCFAMLLVWLAVSSGLAIQAAEPDSPQQSASGKRVLRVGADPNNLPFNNSRLEGFENKIAALLADDLKSEIEYVWKPQRRSFFRQMLSEGQADLVIGAPADVGEALTTRPYYRSSYVFVYRKDGPTRVSGFADPVLKEARIGVQLAGRNGTPPALELAARGLISNVHSYAVYGDTKEESPVGKIIEAVADNELDVAIVWGPVAGYFAKQQEKPLAIVPVSDHDTHTGLRFSFDIAMGVRKNNHALCKELDQFLVRRHDDIEAILRQYGVPKWDKAAGGKQE